MKSLSAMQLKGIRREHSIRRAAMARFCGVDPSTIYRWESKSPPHYAGLLYEYYLKIREENSVQTS